MGTMAECLQVELEMMGPDALRVAADSPGAGQARGSAPPPFTPAELATILEALAINRAVRGAFRPEEVEQLRAWKVMSGDLKAGASGWVELKEDDIHWEVLLDLVQRRLYAALFPNPELRTARDQALARVPAGQSLHVRLELPAGGPDHVQDVQLFQYPWEVLCYDSAHLWQNRRVTLSRYIRFPAGVAEPEPVDRLNLLVVTSRPKDLAAGPGSDVGSIATALRRRVASYPVRVRELPRATLEDLGDYLAERRGQADSPRALHFDGHGAFGRRCPSGHLSVNPDATVCPECGRRLPEDFSGYLAFERADGPVRWVSADELADMLLDQRIGLVVLNACNSGAGRRGPDVFNGAAQALVRRGIPAVAASAFPLDWEAGLGFAHYFYQGLGQGDPLVEVVDRARQRLRGLAETPCEWYRPALYLRQGGAGDGQLFHLRAGSEAGVVDGESEPARVHICSFGDLPRELPEKALNWHRYFDRDTSPRSVPDPRTWERVLLPELRERRLEIGRRGLIHVEPPGALSIGLAVGHTFKEVGQYCLEVVQSSAGPPQVWRSDRRPPEAGRVEPHWLSQALPGDLAREDAVMVMLAVPRRRMGNLAREVGDYLGEGELFEQFVATGGGESRKFKGALFLEAAPAVAENRFIADWEAAALSRSSREHLGDFLARFKPRVAHLFLAVPFGLAVFLGHQWNALNTVVQCYEFVGGPRPYAPACRLDLS